MPDGEPADPGSIEPRFGRLLDPAQVPVDEVPEVEGVAGEDIDRVPFRDEPLDHRPGIQLRPADTGIIPMNEPGHPHPIRALRIESFFSFARSCRGDSAAL